MNNDQNIIGYCAHCKDEIFEGADFVVSGEEMYHPFCYRQLNTFYDPFEDAEELES